MPRILGCDSSLTGTGLARFDIYPDRQVETALATVRAPKAKTGDKSPLTTSRRIEYIIDAIGAAIIDGEKPDLFVLEDIPYGAKGDAQSKLNWLWGRIVDLVRGHGIPLVTVHNTAVKTFATGKGSGAGSDKDSVMLAMANRHPELHISNNNESDAAILAFIGARLLECPVDTMPVAHLKAMTNGKVVLHT